MSLVCIACPAVDPGLLTRAHKVCTCVYVCVCPMNPGKVPGTFLATCMSLARGSFAFISFSLVLFGEDPYPAMRGLHLSFLYITEQLRDLGAGVVIGRTRLGEFRECCWGEGL